MKHPKPQEGSVSTKETTVFDYAVAGERLYALRVALGRSRSDVVRDSDGTLDETYLGRVETGVAVASTLRVRRALARGLGVRTDDLTDLLDGRLTVERVVERATATMAERLMLASAEHDTVVDLVLYLRDELASVAAERDRLQRACDEGLPREVIPCPLCKVPHVEGPRHDDPTMDGRTRPHHHHRCYGCGHVWDDGRWTFGVAPGGENDVTRRLRAEGLREALDACNSIKGRLLDAAMEGGGSVACDEAFGEGDEYDADEDECEFIAAGASMCTEAVEALLAKGGGA